MQFACVLSDGVVGRLTRLGVLFALLSVSGGLMLHCTGSDVSISDRRSRDDFGIILHRVCQDRPRTIFIKPHGTYCIVSYGQYDQSEDEFICQI